MQGSLLGAWLIYGRLSIKDSEVKRTDSPIFFIGEEDCLKEDWTIKW